MPTYSSGGQFGGSPYNNPNMQGWNNTSSQGYQWQQGFAPDQASWVGSTPGHQGQNFSYNPQTGEQGWVNTPGVGIGQQRRAGGGGMLSWTDPTTGNQMIDPGLLMGQFGGSGSGSGGYQSYNPSGYSGGQVTPGEGYQAFDYSTIGSGINPGEVIGAQEYKLQEAMEGDMAKAGARAGASGFGMSTPYMDSLGAAARKASQDRNALTMQYQYDAAQQQAQRDLQQQMQAANLDFGGWQTGYQGDLQAQMFNQGQGFDEWMAKNNWGFQDNQGQNQWNMQQQNQQQQLLASLLGGLF